MTLPSRHSGGPQTAEGKAVCRLNALKHGGRASTLIARAAGEDRYEQLRAEMVDECRPVGPRERSLVDQMTQCALQADFTGIQLRAAVRDVSRTCEGFVGAGSPEANDAALRMSVEAPAVMLASRYNASAMSGFLRAHAQLRVLQDERRACATAPVAAEIEIEPAPDRISPALEKLREIISDAGRRNRFLWELYSRETICPAVEGSDPPPLNAEILSTALQETFLAKTGLQQQVALLFAAEYLAFPDAPISALCARAGLRRRVTALKLRDRLLPSGEARRDWLLRGLETYVRSP